MNDNYNNTNAMMTVAAPEQDALMNLDFDNVLAIAERADKMVGALNKIMAAAIKITTAKDWCLIGGTPYLQEAGASKVARLFGIGWVIHPGYPKVEMDSEGYPTYTYRMTFSMGGQQIEAEGMRSSRDEFFAGKRTGRNGEPLKQKSVDEIDLADVKRAAYTNCLNRGIKGILPGLRNLDVADLEAGGINIGNSGGYTFKTGSRGGNSGKAEDSGIVCESCGAAITQREASYSQSKYGRALCRTCQRAPAPAAGTKAAGTVFDVDYEERPPFDDRDAPPERR